MERGRGRKIGAEFYLLDSAPNYFYRKKTTHEGRTLMPSTRGSPHWSHSAVESELCLYIDTK